MIRLLALLCLCFAVIAMPARAQTEDGRLQPLNVESDINGVNLITGQARRPVPVLQIPAAPNLRLERLNILLPFLSGQLQKQGETVLTDLSINRGGLTSESFECETQAGCTAQQGTGSGLTSNIRFNGTSNIIGTAQYTEAGSGRRVFFLMAGQLGVSAGGGEGTFAYYASEIRYPNGETLLFTYETPNSAHPALKRPTHVTSNLGYVMVLTWRSNDVEGFDWQILATATIYRSADMNTPLARHIYEVDEDGTTLVDLSGRRWSCCGDSLPSRAEAPDFIARLPGMGVDSFVATSSTFGAFDHWTTRYVSDGAVYNYSYVVKSFSGSTHVFPDEVTVTGPEGYALTADIAVSSPLAPDPAPSVITSVTNALNQQTNYTYGPYARLERITYPEGNAVSVTYDAVANITHRRVHAKPESGQPTLEERAHYDITQAAYSCEVGGNPDVRCWRPIWTRDEAGNQTDYEWDAQGNLLTMVEPVDANGRRRKTINTWTAHTFGSSTIYRLTRRRICSEEEDGTNVDCDTAAEQRTTTVYWNDTFLPLTVRRTNGTGSPGATTTYSYDNAGRLLSEDGPLSGDADAAFYRYDASGRRTWEIGRVGDDGASRAATYTILRAPDDQPDEVRVGRVASPSDPTLIQSHRTSFNYNDRRLPTRERLIGGTTIFALSQHDYDDRNRRVCTAVRMNPAVFDTLTGNACQTDTPGSMGEDRIRRTTYDELSRPTRIVGGYGVLNGGAGNVEIEMRYTDNGQVRWREDGNANRTDYSYDAYDRLRRTDFPDDTFERLLYDSRGNVVERLTRAGQRIDHVYDGAGRLTMTSYEGLAPGENDILYDYDGQGRETRIERPGTGSGASLIEITYDSLGRRESETQDGRRVSWLYDSAGRPTRLTWPDNVYVTYDHTPAAQLTAIRDSAGAALITYDYDDFGRMRSIDRANGLATTYTLDPVARLARIWHEGLLYTDFTYNPASQLVTRAASRDEWAWDEGLNVDLDYEVNTLNQYTSADGTSFDYDLNGNLTEVAAGAVSDSYVYDPENRLLTSVRDSGATIELRYDGRGRLRRREGAGTTEYLYDGDAMIAEYSGGGEVLRRYIHGAGVDDPLIWYEGATTGTADRRFLHADERGSITTVTNNAGGIIARNIYDEWGVPGAGNIGRFQYTGQQWLPELGLYYYKSRYYDPELGRFMQTDPIGYEDGMNVYTYVGNDPLNIEDPTGTQGCGSRVADACSPIFSLGYQILQELEEIAERQQSQASADRSQGSGEQTPGAPLTEAHRRCRSCHGVETTPDHRYTTEAENERLTTAVSTLIPWARITQIPRRAYGVARIAQRTGSPPPNHVGGRVFQNREGRLPRGGNYVYYDVRRRPTQGFRGPERIVIDTRSGRRWYTPDHYRTFYPF